MSRRKTNPESPRDRLRRLLQRANTSSPAALCKWLLHELPENLRAEWESYRTSRLNCDPIKHVHDDPINPVNKDFVIVLMHQHSWFESECARLQRQVDEYWDERTEGTLGLGLQWALAKDKPTKTRLYARIEQQRAAFARQKQLEETKEELAASKRGMKLRRSRKPDKPFVVNWCQPMPVTSEKEPVGYCQATAQHERKVINFLRTQKLHTKQATPLKHPGRGAPLKRYTVATNLRVLDVWLGEWLPQEPNRIADTIFSTLLWQMTEEAAPKDVDRFRKAMRTHWRRIKDHLTNPELIREGLFFQRVMTDGFPWQRLVQIAKASRAKSETELSKKTELSTSDPFMRLLAHNPASA